PDNNSEVIRDLNGNNTGLPAGFKPASGTSAMKGGIQNMSNQGIFVSSVQVAPSEILSASDINSIVSRLIGKTNTMQDVQAVINDLNKLYENKGYITARAFLPEQTVNDGHLYIGLMESRVGAITVENNKYTTDGFITKRMPEKAGEIFDVVELEKNVLDFNRYHEGVNLTANLKAGTQPGTTDIELNAHENFPFHIAGVMDNAGRYTTGRVRGGAMLYNDSLFHHRDKISLGSYFSKYATSPFFDYNFPVNKKDGRVGFLYSSTFSKIGYGAYDWMKIRSNSYIYSLYYQQPIVRKPGFELKTLTSLDYKRSRTFSDNDSLNDAFNAFFGRGYGDVDQVTSVTAGLQMRKDTKYGIWYADQNFSYAFPLLDSDSSYFKFSGDVVRLHDFSHGVIGQLRSNYQCVTGDKYIPYLDQFQTGGLATVRGYNEGIMIGKNGYFLSGELMFPLLPRTIAGKNGERHKFIGSYIKGAIFADTAGVFPAAKYDVMQGSYFVASIGMGLRVQLPGDLSARLYWGYPLINNAWETDRKYGRFHFELTLAPDFDALLASRYRKEQAKAAPQATPPQYVENYPDPRHYDYFRDGGGGSL
ncbi:MAG: BamA/TamA family outer membrane protein, partial [Clostridiaceae bacterium]|nr:BamA/TamA family outer membrane protein [Clostridiaceae bacterium]